MNRTHVLGVPIDILSRTAAQHRIQEFLHSPFQHQIATPNPEMLVAARSHPGFLQVLRSTSLNIADGFGILLAARLQGTPLPERITGVDFLQDFCRTSSGVSVFLLGAAPCIAERTARVLIQSNPQLLIAGAHAGNPDAAHEEEIIAQINACHPAVLFVAYGAPAQELWIARNLHRIPSVKVAMGVGGAFDFIAGVQRRAPGWMQHIGMEWVWRLLCEPQRWKRIFNAAIVFPWLWFRERF